MILQMTIQTSCKTHKWGTIEKSRQQCALSPPPRGPLSRLLATSSHLAVPNHDQDGRTALSSHSDSSANHGRHSTDHPSSRYITSWRRLSTTTDHSRLYWLNLQGAGQTSFVPKPVWTVSQSRWKFNTVLGTLNAVPGCNMTMSQHIHIETRFWLYASAMARAILPVLGSNALL